MARERSNVAFDYGNEVVTTGGTGFGIMAMIVAAERGWVPRDSVSKRLLKMVKFLSKADHYHGIFPHWLNGGTGKIIPFGRKDDGGDLVESSFLFQGLLCAKQYFQGQNDTERDLRNRITWIWEEAEWDWYTRGNPNQLFWHWSPNNGWAMNFELRGYNETLITYIMAASSPRYPITAQVYNKCWAQSDHFKNGKEFYGVKLPLGFDFGGPLIFCTLFISGTGPA